ncbi:hypothetical protein BCIN_13g05880 [Botrytis cinerea B05.10]|uniref:DUF4238 domain-containing protein n=2 Tax=Botryotinia fuckeliana TaxID=40559 RepID=A0A384K1N8_BOTFB|nr:hypothetical protein BCIN_13g05880 [Botrytis cinerea B05.10]ATZ56756.1 hypothetical protein BCIN_13g05880 [Botrytis cinerea B05.10]EMR83661.1 hypothetical protein BcDW1_7716 [Botrytis cinerea BcDW1]
MDSNSKSQNQHYIPRFLLKHFAYPYKKQAGTKKQQHLLHAVNLVGSSPELVEVTVKHTFAERDMYKDDSKLTPKQQMRIEEKLGRLESAVSNVIRKIVRAQENGKKDIWMSRSQKDLLRKFLWVMKYRSPIFFKRFNHQKAEDYDANDKHEFLEYMRKMNFQRPLDVWFDNLTKIMDTTMDPEGKWVEDLFEHIYPGDALWVFANIQTMYLALCTPSDPSEEFILTENAFSIHEGPVSYKTDRRTGKQTQTAYTEFHVIGVISPSLIMILRHNLLPEPIEDRDEDVRKQKAGMLMFEMQCHIDPKNARSLLKDLPVAKARNSYTKEVGGRLLLAEGKDGARRSSDRFCFTLFRLPSEHVQMLNSVMLDQACNISKIVYRSRSALKTALEFYLDMPTQTNGIYSMKTITERPDDPYKRLLEKLEHVARDLGSNIHARYHVDPLEEGDSPIDFEEHLARDLGFKVHTRYPVDPIEKGGSPVDFEDAVIEVLKRSSTIVGDPIRLCMEILVKIVSMLQLTIRSIHAIDLIANDRPEFPEMVYREIQKVSQGSTIQLSYDIISMPSYKWRYMWETLCSTALAKSEGSVASDIEEIKKKLVGSNYEFLSHGIRSPRYWEIEAFSRTSSEFEYRPDSTLQTSQEIKKTKSDTTSVQRNSGLSKSGIMKAFDQIGHDLTGEWSPVRQTTSHISKNGSDQIFGEHDPQTSMRDIERAFEKELAPNKNTIMQTEKYNKIQESNQIETPKPFSLVRELKKLDGETIADMIRAIFVIVAFMVLLFKALMNIVLLIIGVLSFIIRPLWYECVSLREEPFHHECAL